MDTPTSSRRYFVSYSGVQLPLRLVNPLEADEIDNRNTYFCACYDAEERMTRCEKRVYGEVEFSHDYTYHPSGRLSSATIQMQGDEPQRLEFPDQA